MGKEDGWVRRPSWTRPDWTDHPSPPSCARKNSELSRCGSGGILYGLLGGFGISVGPILHFGSDELRKRIVPALLRGEKRSCLAITEPEGGSDVANIVTEAKKTEDDKHYIINGCVPAAVFVSRRAAF